MKHPKSTLLLLLFAFTPTIQAEITGGITLGAESLEFDTSDRNGDNAIQNNEAAESPNYSLSGWMSGSVMNGLDFGLLAHFEQHSPSDVETGPMDDSFERGYVLQGSLIKPFNDDTSIALGLNYGYGEENEDAGETEIIEREFLGIDLALAHQIDRFTGMVVAGAYENLSAEDSPDGTPSYYADDVIYYGVVADVAIYDGFSFGGSYTYFDGKRKHDELPDENDKKADFYSLYGQYDKDNLNIKIGYRKLDFEDQSDDEWMEADAVFIQVGYKFGSAQKKTHRMLITQKPRILQYDGFVSGQIE
jgi:hypothetical protein